MKTIIKLFLLLAILSCKEENQHHEEEYCFDLEVVKEGMPGVPEDIVVEYSKQVLHPENYSDEKKKLTQKIVALYSLKEQHEIQIIGMQVYIEILEQEINKRIGGQWTMESYRTGANEFYQPEVKLEIQ